MKNVKDIIQALGASDELSRLRLSMDSTVKRFLSSVPVESDWETKAIEKLENAHKLAVIGCNYADHVIFNLLKKDYPDRMAIDVFRSIGADCDAIDSIPYEVYSRYFKDVRGKCLICGPLSKDLGKMIGMFSVFSVGAITTLEHVIRDAEGEARLLDKDLGVLLPQKILNYLEYCLRLLEVMTGRYGKSWIFAVVDDPSAGEVAILSPVAAADAIIDCFNFDGVLMDLGLSEDSPSSSDVQESLVETLSAESNDNA